MLWLAPADVRAQSADAASNAALRDEVTRLHAELEALKAEMRAIRDQALGAKAAPPAAPPPPVVAQSAPVPPAPKPDALQSAWRGAPEFRSADGWSFKPRGRFQVDGGYLSAPDSRLSAETDGLGFTNRVRRAYLGVQGTIPGGFGYRMEVDLSSGSASWTDAYVSYDNGPFNVTVGQHHPFTSMEQLQSDLFLSFNERAAFIGAFNLERRVGVSVGYRSGTIMANAGVFTDDIASLSNDGNKSVSYDGRVVWMPRFGDMQVHVGGSAHYRDLGQYHRTFGTRYRHRPYINTTDIRYMDTGILTVTGETLLGGELALNRKRFHAVGEISRLRLERPGDTNPAFLGGYAEAGMFLTDDTRSYRNGTFDRITPRSPVGAGGFGALEVNVRYDHLDMSDAGVRAGVQDAFGASLVWVPVAYVRFIAGYMHVIYDIPALSPKFNAEVVGLRAQVDF